MILGDPRRRGVLRCARAVAEAAAKLGGTITGEIHAALQFSGILLQGSPVVPNVI